MIQSQFQSDILEDDIHLWADFEKIELRCLVLLTKVALGLFSTDALREEHETIDFLQRRLEEDILYVGMEKLRTDYEMQGEFLDDATRKKLHESVGTYHPERW